VGLITQMTKDRWIVEGVIDRGEVREADNIHVQLTSLCLGLWPWHSSLALKMRGLNTKNNSIVSGAQHFYEVMAFRMRPVLS